MAQLRAQFRASDVPGLGYSCYSVERSGQAPATWVAIEGLSISNERFLVEADPQRGGCLSRVLDRRTDRDALSSGQVGNELLVYPEYPLHPKMSEGPWHLLPSGPPVGSSSGRATVQAERSVLGERLIIEGQVDGTSYTQVVTLLTGSAQVRLRAYLHGFKGADRLVRLRFPVAAKGATPLAEVGNAVVARGVGFIDVDSAEAPWTLDTPVQNWAGVGSTLSVGLAENESPFGSRALGIAEVVVPAGAGTALHDLVRALLIALASKGVTASCTEAAANRYGGLVGDSNLPDFRISIGGPEDNGLTAAALEMAGSSFRSELDRQLGRSGQARLWVPATRPSGEVWVPNADVRGAGDLPVLVLVGSDGSALEKALAGLVEDVRSERLVIDQPAALSSAAGANGSEWATDWTFALLNRGTPGFAVDTGGAIYSSLLRSCTGWPSGVWIDPPRRTAPDGSNFELEHWDHVFDHALVTGEGDWRATGCVIEAQEFNTPLVAVAEAPHNGSLPPSGSFLEVEDQTRQVVLAVLKPAGNPLAAGLLPVVPGTPAGGSGAVVLTARLYESAGREATATLSAGLSWSIRRAWASGSLEEEGEPLDCRDGKLTVQFGPAETRTVRLELRRTGTAGATAPGAGTSVPVEAPAAGAPAVRAAAVEAAQPTFSRYWLHNKGPAPMGNQLLAVHIGPTSLRLRTGETASLVATVASGAVDDELAGNLEIVVPPGWTAEPPSRLFNLSPGAHASVPFKLVPPPRTRPSRFFVAARALDGDGQAQEDVATIDVLPVDPLGPYRAGTGGSGTEGSVPERSFDHPSAQVGVELDASLSKDSLTVAPGSSQQLALVLRNRTSSELRGEAQLISPLETWSFAGPWTQGFTLAPHGQTEVPFVVTVPANSGSLSSWVLVKVMYFGRLWYSPAVPLEIAPGARSFDGQ